MLWRLREIGMATLQLSEGMFQVDTDVIGNIGVAQRDGYSITSPRSVQWYLADQRVHVFILDGFTDVLFRATREQNVDDGQFRLTKSLAKQRDEVSKLSCGHAFIKGINNKRRRWTLGQPVTKPPKRLEKKLLHLVTKGLVRV
jgi:hypothetical protein